MTAQTNHSGQPFVAAALGLFDGVHLGHRSVIAAAASLGVCHAVTFSAETMPQKQEKSLRYIYDTRQKQKLLEESGADSVTALDFSSYSMLDGLTFCQKILCERLHTNAVVCGEDYRFGYRAACDTEDLRRFGEMLGFQTIIVPKLCDKSEQPISSSRIRVLLEEGEMITANRLLGTDYTVYSEVIRGNALGRTMGFPTANQALKPFQCVPKRGVYASVAEIDGMEIPAITNIGLRPTVTETEKRPLAETHLLGWNGELSGKMLTVRLSRFLRAERKFSGFDELAAQIRTDIAMRRTFE